MELGASHIWAFLLTLVSRQKWDGKKLVKVEKLEKIALGAAEQSKQILSKYYPF